MNKNKKLWGAFCVLLWFWIIGPAVPLHAAINQQINFQGKITNPDGTNLTNGSVSFTFSFYTVASGGTATWTETKNLTVTDGIFQTALGDTTALPGSVDFNNASLYLGVQVASDAEMTPRIRMGAAPYAFNADRLGGLTSSQYVQLSPGGQQSGFINISGNATVGGTYNTNAFTSSALTFGAAGAASIQSASAQALTVDSGTTGALNLGTSSNAKAITIGNTTGATTITNLIGASTTAYIITAASSVDYFSIDTTNTRVYIGNATADGTGTLLVLDTKNTAGDPTGVNGGMYYNSNTNKFRCYQNSLWKDCTSRNTVYLAADVTNNNATANTIADVTGLSFPVTSGETYNFYAQILYTAAATTTGSRWSINGPATTFLSYSSAYGLTATTETLNYAAAYNVPAASNATSISTTGNTAIISGTVQPSANGTIIVRFASEVSSSAIVAKAGSTLEWWTD